MKKKIVLLIAITILTAAVPYPGVAVSRNIEGLTVSFDKTEMNAGDTITASFRLDNDRLQIQELEWINVHDGEKYGDPDYPSEKEGTSSFQPVYDGVCYFSVTCVDEEYTQYLYRSPDMPVHGMTIEVKESLGLYPHYKSEIDTDYFIDPGKEYRCDVTIMKAIGTVTSDVTLTAETKEGTLKTSKQTYQSDTFSFTYTPGDNVIAFRAEIWAEDSNGGRVTWQNRIGIHYSHQLTAHERVEPTYSSTGTEAYWECRECGKLFSDPEGKHEISQPVVIPVLTEASDDAPAEVTLKKIKISSVTSPSKKKIKITWKKLSSKDRKKAKRIEIQISTDKSFSSNVIKKFISSGKKSVTVSGLVKNTKYYVRIRTFTIEGNRKYVSPWSSKKKVKTRK